MEKIQKVDELLERKNFCFRSFLKICQEFVDTVDQQKEADLETFQRKREGLIKVLEQLDVQISTRMQQSPNAEEKDPETRKKVAALLTEKEGLIRSILDIDLKVLAYVDRLKDETIRKLQAIQTSKKTTNAYKSPLETVETAENSKSVDREV
jgi:hypothetical protein